MKEFVEKLIGRLEEHKTKAYVTGFTNNPYELGACHAMDDAVKIVNQLAEEYNNGWIPCSERLPNEDERVLCQGKHSMFVAFVDSFDGEWRDGHHYKRTNVIAWQPLPDPYIPKQEEQKG